jgi:hypothetical protein
VPSTLPVEPHIQALKCCWEQEADCGGVEAQHRAAPTGPTPSMGSAASCDSATVTTAAWDGELASLMKCKASACRCCVMYWING